jgi:signal transduction histidine kinase/CheY-like chemotaxis protein
MLDPSVWQRILELESAAADKSRDAVMRDREAAALDRTAADKDRDAAEHDRSAAASDRIAADKDRDAAEKDRQAADEDRDAADSDRGRTEHELELADEHLLRQERLASMGSFAAGVAHEVNNPLATLLLTLQGLDRRLRNLPSGGDEALSLLGDARLAAERIRSVIADMRAWLHDSPEIPPRQPIDLPSLVNDSLRLVNPEVQDVAKVVVDLQPTPPVWGVASQLGQVLTNLLLNAAHAVSGDRDANEIRVSVRAADGANAAVWIEVRDTGPGIAPDVLPHIFDPFFTTREGSGGTGIGLATCDRIVSEHGGALTVTTQLGNGSCFRVELPCGTEGAVHPSSIPPAPPSRPRVLLIDDDESFARSIATVLDGHAEVTRAINGREGLDYLLKPDAHYDLVLCDIMMPVMNGLETYRRLREVAPERAADIVFISGGATTPETAKFLAELPNVRLAKPFEMERLFRLLEERREPAVVSP